MKKLLLLTLLLAMFTVPFTACDNGGSDDDENYPDPDKVCALTFDDGPDNTKTLNVIAKLDAHGVKGSFFQIGQLISGNQDAVDAITDRGFEIHNHSWAWDSLGEATVTEAEINTSVDDTTDAIVAATPDGYTDNYTMFFRPPNLSTSTLLYDTVDMPFSVGIVAGDFPTEYGGTATIEGQLDNILNSSDLRNGAIILMHDVQSHDYYDTPGLLDLLIPELKKLGYEMMGLSEMFTYLGVDPTSEQSWNVAE